MAEKERKSRAGRPERYPGEEPARISAMARPRYKDALEILAKHRQTSLAGAAEFAIAYMGQTYEIDGKPLLDYVRPANESFQRYRYNACNSTAFEMAETDWFDEHFSFKNILEERQNIPPSLRGQFDDFATEVLTWLEPADYAPMQWFNIDGLLDAIKEDWKEGKSIEQTAATIILVAKLRMAEYIYSYQQGDKGTLAPIHDKVLLSAAEMAEMEKMLGAPDWIRYREFFKQV